MEVVRDEISICMRKIITRAGQHGRSKERRLPVTPKLAVTRHKGRVRGLTEQTHMENVAFKVEI